MSNELWGQVDRYVHDRLIGDDPALAHALSNSEKAGLPSIAVSAAQGKFLSLLARAVKAQRILEIGTLGGYSAIWFARALPESGHLTTLEYDAHHAETARMNLAFAGLAEKVTVIVGPAIDSLAKLTGPFDLVFIDANKDQMKEYAEWAVKLTEPGAVIICDNMVRDGEVLNDASEDQNIRGIRAAYDFLHNHPQLDSTALQIVGGKGYDGFTVSLRV